MVGLNGYDSATSKQKLYATLDTIDKDQPLLLYLQESVQQLGPLFYVVLIEIAVITSAFLTSVFLTVWTQVLKPGYTVNKSWLLFIDLILFSLIKVLISHIYYKH